jgi:hypothetical protein
MGIETLIACTGVRSVATVRVVDLVDDRPLTVDLHQIEKIREAKPRDIVRIDAGVRYGANDIDSRDSGLRLWRWPERGVDRFEKPFDRPPSSLLFSMPNMVACSLKAGRMIELSAFAPPSLYLFSTSTIASYS